MNRIIRVDHTRYKKRDDETEDDQDQEISSKAVGTIEARRREIEVGEDSNSESERPVLREEHELAILTRYHDDDDPMKTFLIQEKRREISAALAKLKDSTASKSDKKSKSRHHHHHRSHRSKGSDEHEDGKWHS